METENNITTTSRESQLNGISRDADEKSTVLPAPNGSSSEAAENLQAVSTVSARKLKPISWLLVVACIESSTFLFAIDTTIVADIQTSIIEDFNGVGKLTWVSVAFMLATTGTNLLWGRIYGTFDVKYIYILSTIIFEVGSAICGSAPNMNALIVGRAICGLGGIGMYIGVMTVTSLNTSKAERPMYLALIGIIWGIGIVVGPFIGGAFADSSATWRWGFYINLCIGAVFAPVYIFLIPSGDPQPGLSFFERCKQIDLLGAVLLLGFIACLLMGISFGGLLFAWNSGSIIALFVVSGILFLLLAVQQGFAIGTTKNLRIIPVKYLRSKEIILLFIETACAGAALFLPIYFIPVFFEIIHNESALAAGLRLLPFIVVRVIMTFVTSFALTKWGYYMPYYVLCSIPGTIGSALLYTISRTTSLSAIYGFTALMGFSGSYSQASFAVAQYLVDPADISIITGFMTCAQSGGAAIALAIGDTVFLNTAQNGILKLLPNLSLSEIQGLISGLRSSLLDTFDQATQNSILNIIMNSFRKLFILPIVAGALALFLSFFLSRQKLNIAR